MTKLLILLAIAVAAPACGKKNAPPPANAGDMKKEATGEKAADPSAATPAADPCAGKTADPCAGAKP